MATTDLFIAGERSPWQASPAQTTADILEFPSAAQPCVNNPDTNPVVDFAFQETEEFRHGVLETYDFKFSNGEIKRVRCGIPDEPLTDIVLFGTPALGTSIEGHNEHTQRELTERGHPTVEVSAEGAADPLPRSLKGIYRLLKNMVSVSLEDMATELHEVMSVTDTFDFYTPGRFSFTAESRGAAAGLGMLAFAHYWDREPVYADLIAPPFPKSIESWRRGVGLLNTIAPQSNLLGNLPVKVHPKRLINYPRTLDLNPIFLAHVITTIPALWTGEAGRYAYNSPENTHLHATLFEDDIWSYPQGWRERFADNPNAVIDPRPGKHMAITRESTQRDRLARFEVLAEELQAHDQDPAKVDWHRVHKASTAARRAA